MNYSGPPPSSLPSDGRITALEEELEALKFRIHANRWMAPLRGGFPATEVRDTLPTAAVEFQYQLITIRGTPDVTYQCLRNAGAAWGWRVVATG